MAIGIDPNEVYSYILSDERESKPEEQTIFYLKPLTAAHSAKTKPFFAEISKRIEGERQKEKERKEEEKEENVVSIAVKDENSDDEKDEEVVNVALMFTTEEYDFIFVVIGWGLDHWENLKDNKGDIISSANLSSIEKVNCLHSSYWIELFMVIVEGSSVNNDLKKSLK